ncbi:hypothetical protein [Vibrio cholerae]|uniref:hypothetical protein n=1 Tax=Vibrio cholerae TaxID=666 RepID=UPI002152BD01
MTHRKHSHAFGTITLTVTACLLLWGFQLPAWAGDATQVEPLALRKIMQELGRNMQAITGAISQKEWVQVVQLAPKVAAHPEPPLTEKMRILAYLGADATKFRNFDAQTHEAALAMKLAAASISANLRQAQELLAAQAGSTQYPQVDVALGSQRQQMSPSSQGLSGDARQFSLYNASVGVHYNLDLAGGNRRALEAYLAELI